MWNYVEYVELFVWECVSVCLGVSVCTDTRYSLWCCPDRDGALSGRSRSPDVDMIRKQGASFCSALSSTCTSNTPSADYNITYETLWEITAAESVFRRTPTP